MRLGHVVVLVRNLDDMIAFYVEVVDLQISDIGTAAGRPGTPRIALLSWDPATIHHQIALLEVRPDPNAPRNVHHIAFEVDSLADLRAIWARVRSDQRCRSLDPAADGPVTAFIGDQWSIRFADPEGNGIEIYAPTPWDTRAAMTPYSTSGLVFEPFDIAADDATLIAWGERQLAVMGMDYWPRGERPWTSKVKRRTVR